MNSQIPLYNFQATEPDKTLQLNEYHFTIALNGEFLKSKNLQEFEEISSWNNFLFSGIVKSNQFVHFKIAQTWYKKLFSRLQTSKTIETGVFDIHLLQTELSSHISKIKIGGKQIPETYELL